MERDPLEDHFAALKMQAPEASPDLLARVLGDALALQPKVAVPTPVAPVRRPGFWASLSGALGGGGAFAGLGGAAALGLALGYTDPATLSDLSGGWFSTSGDGLELVPAAELFLSEG